MSLEVKSISFSYQANTPILKDVSLSLHPHEIVGLKAPSGYGKSTLAKLMSGYEPLQQGEVLVDGAPLSSYKGFSPVQLAFQHPEKSVNPRWKIEKILNEGWPVSQEIKDCFGIEDYWLEKWPNELSGGELQRICLARILSPETRYVMADEITTMVDAISQVELSDILKTYVQQHECGILWISHNEALLEHVADRMIDLSEINKIEKSTN